MQEISANDGFDGRAPVFTEAAGELASDHDVIMCYQTLLGRNPENSFVIEEAKTQSVQRLIEGFLSSAEFYTSVVEALEADKRIVHEAESIGPTGDQAIWLLSQFRLPPSTTKAIVSASNWTAFFTALLEVSEIKNLVRVTDYQELPPRFAGINNAVPKTLDIVVMVTELMTRLSTAEAIMRQTLDAMTLLRKEISQLADGSSSDIPGV